MWCGFHTNDVWLSHAFISHVACGYHTTPFCVDLTQLSVCVQHVVCLAHTGVEITIFTKMTHIAQSDFLKRQLAAV